MKPLDITEVQQYVQDHIGIFHRKRLEGLEKLKLKDVLKRKNPYLFKAKNVLTAAEIVRGIVDAHISSSEEGIFGDWLEGLAIFVNEKVYGGRKSAASGIDLEFERDSKRYVVAIKSGPNWGNSSQYKKMVSDFKAAGKILRTSGSTIEIIAVNGCCYGRDGKPDKGDYFKYCGQQFWEFISGDPELYIRIIEPLGTQAQLRNDEFEAMYAAKINLFHRDFVDDFCLPTGIIDWAKLIQFNSGKEVSRPRKQGRR